MKQSLFPSFVKKEFPKDEDSYNAKMLVRAGFVNKLMAGVYSYLPLGLRVIKKIENIVRQHMDKIGYEILMPILHPKELWQKTDRWFTFNALFKMISNDKKEYALGPTHEEIVVPLAKELIFSYKDLPFGLYQIQTKLRDEPRAKSGLLRGREFIMKDLYSFHTDSGSLKKYYNEVKNEYKEIFKDLGINALIVEASGGTFSKFSHEFQVQIESGEDTIVICNSCGFAQNEEINNMNEGDSCPKCGKPLKKIKVSEVGNIFELNTKYSKPFNLMYKDRNGDDKIVYMGCYGIGISRLMGVIAEVFHDDKGLMWPISIAPFDVHLISIYGSDNDKNNIIESISNNVYKRLINNRIDVLFDDRKDKNPGEKLVESDIIGIPIRIIVSEKTGHEIEFKLRNEDNTYMYKIDDAVNKIKEVISKK